MFRFWPKKRPVPGAWSTGPAPENKVLIVGAYGSQFSGGDGSPIQFPPQVAFACAGPNGWTNFTTGWPLGWAPDCWMVLRDMPDRAPEAPFWHHRASDAQL